MPVDGFQIGSKLRKGGTGGADVAALLAGSHQQLGRAIIRQPGLARYTGRSAAERDSSRCRI
jgi:hypothetical protein